MNIWNKGKNESDIFLNALRVLRENHISEHGFTKSTLETTNKVIIPKVSNK